MYTTLFSENVLFPSSVFHLLSSLYAGMSPSERLITTPKAVVLLREKLSNVEITTDDDPKPVWNYHPFFVEQKLDNFRTRSNYLKMGFLDKFGMLYTPLIFWIVLVLLYFSNFSHSG